MEEKSRREETVQRGERSCFSNGDLVGEEETGTIEEKMRRPTRRHVRKGCKQGVFRNTKDSRPSQQQYQRPRQIDGLLS
ncbi:hypothetical protein Pmani_034700 [Petrolisthes manimaculis]|uniref:Uncharacterized protein n=1 Tax=Petrolisthes manimaculis TaxID=1843537 RepID=A0AAE1NNV3_9EUCA|nr:hypothetical protein Pmani_034700 [Petrolisthes manimaculis]